ncbi:MAG: glycosyltransferase family 39 protein [Candidatus Omnitrophica bacterium]|nr:glycosyltransferase family 39 protein [Candidatus Omnitrophota bacterium]MCB9768145.1 glycosyltransferase family 39 protein [Candidatus Omnitrophota bacterium]
MDKPSKRARGFRFLAPLLLVGLLLRLTGIQFGAPLAVHPDEHNLLFHAMEAGAQRGNPKWFEYPSGMLYLTLAVQGLRYMVSEAATPAEYWSKFVEDPFPFHLWIRVLVAAMGAMGILGIYLLGREWDRKRTTLKVLGLGSALLLSVHFLHVRDSHFATVDIPLTTGVTFLLWLLMREMHRRETNIRRMLLVAVGVGVCCGIKYTAAPLIFPLYYVALTNVIRGEEVRIDLPWLMGSAATLLVAVGFGFILTTPYAILDSRQFWEDIRYQWFTSKSQAAIYGGGEPFIWGYLRGPWMWGGGRVLGIFAFFGFMMAVLRREREDRLLLWFAVPYFLLISFGERVWGRWFLPLVPLQALWTVRFVAEYANHPWLGGLLAPPLRRTLTWIALLLMASTTFIPTIRMLVLMRETDTRVEAAARLDETLEVGDYPLITGFLPPIPKEIPRLKEDDLLNDRKAFEENHLHMVRMESLNELIDEGINTVIYSSFYWEASQQPHVRKEYPGAESYTNFLESLKLRGREIWRISPSTAGTDFNPENIYAPTFQLWRWNRPGPEIRFYELPTRTEG